MSLKEGTRVGPYEIGPLLGAGGMGEVYRARDTRLDRDAALIPVAGGEPVRFVKNNEGIEAADEFHFSPNRKWIAFNATSGGRSEVFIVANPPTSQRWQVSTQGGAQARWRPATNTLRPSPSQARPFA